MLGLTKRKLTRWTGLLLLGRLLVWAVSGALAIFVAGYVLLPLTMRLALPSLLAKHGVPATIASVRVNLIRQEVTLADFMIGEESGPSVRWQEIIARLDGRALLRGELALTHLKLSGTTVNLENLAAWQPPAELTDSSPLTSDSVQLGAGIPEIILDELEMPILSKLIGQRAIITHAQLRPGPSVNGSAMPFSVAGRVADATVTVEGTMMLGNPTIDVQAVLKVNHLALTGLVGLLSEQRVAALTGRASVTSQFAAQFDREDGVLTVPFSGSAGVDALRAVSTRGAVMGEIAVGQMAWDGTGDLRWDSRTSLIDLHTEGSLALKDGSLTDGPAKKTPLAQFESLAWQGKFDRVGASNRSEGALNAVGLSLSGEFGPEPARFRITLDQLSAGLAAVDEGVSIQALRSVGTHIRVTRSGQEQTVSLDEINLMQLQTHGNGQVSLAGLAIPELTLSREKTGSSPAETMLEATAMVVDSATGDWSDSGSETIALSRAATERLTIRLPDAVLRLHGLQTQGLRYAAGQPVQLQQVTVSSVRSRSPEANQEVSQEIDDLLLTEVVVDTELSLTAAAIQVTRFAASNGARAQWSASGIAGRGFRREPNTSIELDEVTLSTLSGHDEGKFSVDGRRLAAKGVQVTADQAVSIAASQIEAIEFAGANAEQGNASVLAVNGLGWSTKKGLLTTLVTIGSVNVDNGLGAAWQISNGELHRLAWSEKSELSSAQTRATNLRWRLADGSEWAFGNLFVRDLVRDGASQFVSGSVGLGELVLQTAAGVTLRTGSVLVTDLAWSSEAGLRLAELGGEQLQVVLGDSRWSSSALTSTNLRWGPEAGVAAAALELRAVGHAGAEGGEFSTDNLSVTQFAWDLERDIGAQAFVIATLSGKLDDRSQWRVAGVEGQGLAVNDAKNLALTRLGAKSLELEDSLHSRHLNIDNIEVGGAEYVWGDSLGVANLVVSGLVHRAPGDENGEGDGHSDGNVLAGRTSTATLPRLAVAQLRSEGARIVGTTAIDFGRVTVNGFLPVLRRRASGDWVLPMEAFGDGEPSETGSTGLRIEALRLGNGSRLTVIDESVQPVSTKVFEPLDAELTGYDSIRPGEAAQFTVGTRVGEFSEVRLAGSLRPTSSGLDWSVTGDVTGINLKDLSGHLRQSMGLGITSGRGDVSFSATVNDGQLDADTSVVLSNFNTTRAAVAVGSEDASSLPLETTLGLLKDKQGIVRLKVPITGPLADPSFDLSNAFGQAMTKTAQTLLMVAFQPFGIIVSAKGLLTKLTDLQFKPVLFEPGRVLPSATGLTYLDTLGERLVNHPQMRVSLCGKAVLSDRSQLPGGAAKTPDPAIGAGIEPDVDKVVDETAQSSAEQLNGAAAVPLVHVSDFALRALAKERSDAVTHYLASRHAVPVEQLLACEPVVEETDGALPRLEFYLAGQQANEPAIKTDVKGQ